MSMAQETSESELLDAIKKLLKKSGHLDKLQAETRAKVTELLKERQDGGAGGGGGPPAPAPEVLLVNELIREYLEWNGYLYTAAVLAAEAGGGARRARAELCAAVGVRDDERSLALPLLANVVGAYVERIRRKLGRAQRDA